MMVEMVSYLHFGKGDVLWLQDWVPQSMGAYIGACIGLLLLAMIDRWIAACRAVSGAHWSKRARVQISENDLSRSLAPSRTLALPFVVARDLPAGLFQVVQSALRFAFMLAVMTFNAGFLMAVVLGAGLGEMLFGRFLNPISQL